MREGPPTIDVLFAIPQGSLLMDVAGPAEAFRLANLHLERRAQPARFRLRFAGAMTSLTSAAGLGLNGLEPLPRLLQAPTWIVLAGQPTALIATATPDAVQIADWLRSIFDRGVDRASTIHRLVAICSGVLIAARAGLLDGRKCTTHHELLEALQSLAPDARVQGNRVFVLDGALASSAGIAAGIDLSLYLIRELCGEALAAAVAGDMVVYVRRLPGDPEESPFLVNRRHLHAAVHRVQDAIEANPQHNWNMQDMASTAHVTPRHLLRLFRENAGVSPLQYLASIRLETARQCLEHGSSVARAAEVAGFNSDLQLRRAWNRTWGSLPRTAARGGKGSPAEE